MSEHERLLTVTSLGVVFLFYLVAIFFFLISDKTRLNYALATQKAIWAAIIAGIALPAYSQNLGYLLPSAWRAALWASLTAVTLWVLVEVYRANKGRIRSRLLQILKRDRTATWPEVDRRSGRDRRKRVSK